jgi:ATP-dependent DNA helicase
MRPEANAERLLSITRSKAKMFEFQIPLEHHIALPQNPNQLFALAVGLLGDAAAAIATNTPDDENRLTPADALRFAATYFDAYVNSRLDGDVAPEFGVLSAAAYYLSSSPGNARVVLKNVALSDAPEQGPLYKLAYRLLSSQGNVTLEPHYGELPRQLLEALDQFYALAAGDAEVFDYANEIRALAYEGGSDRDVLYADVVVAVIRLRIANASRTLLPQASGMPLDQWAPALQKPRFPTELWPAQQRVCAAGLLEGVSALIQMPTSAGKTRATELIIRSAFLSARTDLAVIVAPFRALCHDIRGDLTAAFDGEPVVLDEATDAYQLDFIFDVLALPKTILIVTPEKLLYLLRRTPELAEQIGLLIYDEGHLFDSPGRGVTYELLLTSLKLTVAAHTQVVLISAVIENSDAVAGWLVGDENSVVDGKGMLPTFKSIAFASWRGALGQLRYVTPTDPDDEEFFVPRVIERIDLLETEDFDARSFPASKGQEIGLYLGLKLAPVGPVAVFCGRKDSAAKVCETAVDLFAQGLQMPVPATLSNANEIAALVELTRFHLGEEAIYTGAAALGIFAHHGNVPHGLRLSIEHAMKEGLARFVVCTSTLAQGVNLPIRYLIVTSVQQGQDRILVRDFHNLIGRAGRAGMHTEGSIIFASPDIFDQKTSRTESWRWRAAKELLDPDNSEPCGSNILYAFRPFTSQRLSIAIEMDDLVRLVFKEGAVIQEYIEEYLSDKPRLHREFRRFMHNKATAIQSIFDYLLAHIEFDAEDWTEQLARLVENTLAFHIGDEGQRAELRILFELLADVIGEEASDEQTRIVLKRSPLPAGNALRVKRWLADNQQRLVDAAEGGDLFELVFEFVAQDGLPAGLDNLSDQTIGLVIGEMWFDERTYEEIHRDLRAADVRIGGNNHRLTIDDVVGICEAAFGYQIAMTVATMADVEEGIDDDVFAALSLLQRKLKYGLDSGAAIAFFEAGFADRRLASELGGMYPNVGTRADARATARQNRQALLNRVASYPSYFTAVLREIIGN